MNEEKALQIFLVPDQHSNESVQSDALDFLLYHTTGTVHFCAKRALRQALVNQLFDEEVDCYNEFNILNFNEIRQNFCSLLKKHTAKQLTHSSYMN